MVYSSLSVCCCNATHSTDEFINNQQNVASTAVVLMTLQYPTQLQIASSIESAAHTMIVRLSNMLSKSKLYSRDIPAVTLNTLNTLNT